MGEIVKSRRGANGQFLPGTSGNPAGRPAVPHEVREAAHMFTIGAVQLLGAVMVDPGLPLPARMLAARELLKAAGLKAPRPGEDEAAREAETTLGLLTDDELERLLLDLRRNRGVVDV